MRRLWAYIITTLTAILLVGVSFSLVAIRMTSNLEYQAGKELVFRISEKEEGAELPETSEALDNIVGVMKERLSKSQISSYSIKTAGYDTVKVSFSDSSTNDHYSLISNYLTFNGTLALTDAGDKVALMDNFRNDKAAYVTDENSVPRVVVPVNKDNAEFLAVIESAHEEHDKKESEAEGSEDSETDTTTYVYLWYDFVDGVDSYTNSLDDETMAKKILIPFDIAAYAKDDNGEYPDNLVTAINIDTDGDGTASVAEVQEGYYRAKYFVNLLNAGELDYKVTYLYSNDVDASIESLISLGSVHEYLSMSATLIAALVAFLALSLLFVYLYRLGSLSGIVTLLLTVFATLGFLLLFGVEFNTATFIGLTIAGLLSVASFIVYQQKFKDEAYRGRSIKKANSEGAKKALLPVVDINAVAMIVGLFIFLLGGSAMRGLAGAIVLGGFISLLLNTLALRGMMWMVANTTKLTGKYSYFGILEDKVPNLSNEEKQSYFGTYADIDLKKKRKITSLIAAVLSVASLTGLIVFGAVNKGSLFNNNESRAVASEIAFEAVDNEYTFSETIVRDILDNLLIYQDNVEEENLKSVGSLVNGEINIPDTLSEKVNENGTIVEHIHYFYVANLSKELKLDTVVYVKSEGSASKGSVNEVFNAYLANEGLAEKATIVLKNDKLLTPDYPGFSSITLATFIGVVVASVYLALRYRPSRAIASLLMMSFTGLITMGLFSLCRVVTTSYILSMLPAVTLFAAIVAIMIMNKDRELTLDDRSRDFSLEHKVELLETANQHSFTSIVITTCITLFAAVMFFGFGPKATSTYYIFMFAGIVFAFVLGSILFVPVSSLFMKLFSKIKFERKTPGKKNKKKNKPKASKSAEPEEAIFIGIND